MIRLKKCKLLCQNLGVMKAWVFILLLFYTATVAAQKIRFDFSRVDRHALSVDDHSPRILSYKLTAPYTTELEKVRAIFRWIAEHIAYHVYIPVWKKNAPYMNFEGEYDLSQELPPLNERISSIVLKKRTAVCDQYARLFKTLCDYAGLCSEIVSGYARPDMFRTANKFGTNHTWNAVQIDGQWHLLDVTWASGYLSYNGKTFIKSFDDYYFLTPPELFARDHYPEDIRWALMNVPPDAREYAVSPFRYSGFLKSKIQNYYPAKGLIEAAIGDTIRIELDTNEDVWFFAIRDYCPEPESSAATSSSFVKEGKKISTYHIVTESTGNRLYVSVNDYLVLRYRLKIKPDIKKQLATAGHSITAGKK
jgi:transglutaminase/protease-like cytokinesis protein 3